MDIFLSRWRFAKLSVRLSYFIIDFVKDRKLSNFWFRRLTVRPFGFHPKDEGSTPFGTIYKFFKICYNYSIRKIK